VGQARGTRNLRHSGSGRIPYSLVAIVVLASVVTLSSYLEVVSSYQNLHASYDIPENVQEALIQAESAITQAAHFDLMNSTATLLSNAPFGSSAQLNHLNLSLVQSFKQSLVAMKFLSTGFQWGTTSVTAQEWGLNLTYAQGEVNDTTSLVSISQSSDPNLPISTAVNTVLPDSPGMTQENLYPMAVGNITLLAVDHDSGTFESTNFPFTTSLQSEIGLLEGKAVQFSDDSYGPDGGFARLVQYITTTLGELRALAGYGTSGYPGPHSSSSVDTASYPILSQKDVNDSVSLALLLESLQYFRSYDANAVESFISSIGPGPYQTLLERYVTNGSVDPAALFLLLLNNTSPESYGIGQISSGEGLANAIYSFADRYKFDLLQKFWQQNVVDPTLTEPVADWTLFYGQTSSTYYNNMMTQWLQDYQTWLGVTINSIPARHVTATIPAEANTSGGCSYTILPQGAVTVSNNGVPVLASMVLGTLDSHQLNNKQYVYFSPDAFNIWENVTIGYPTVIWQDGLTGNLEQVGYYVTQRSLLGEYATQDPWVLNGPNSSIENLEKYALTQIINDLSQSMANRSTVSTDLEYKGLLDYMALLGDNDGSNYTQIQAGLPNLGNRTGIETALNDTSYSLLTNGSSSILSGPLAQALQTFAAQATNSTWLNNSWINGAAHPNLLGPDYNYQNLNGNPWTMTDVARLAAREWFQAIYNLYYATSGDISPWPVGIIDGDPMDNWQYDVVSNGVDHNPPVGVNEPDFAMNVQNETYISMMAWMGWQRPNGYECGGYNGPCGETADFKRAYASNNGGGQICFTRQSPAYLDALDWWYGATNITSPTGQQIHTNEEGTGLPSHTWNNVATAVENALNGIPSNPGIDTIHPALARSWWNVKNNTGDAYWNCGVPGVTCPSYDSGNFTNWILRTIAPPILNDTRAMGKIGGWLSQLYNSTDKWLQIGANLSGTVYKPWVDQNMPYTFWWGNKTEAEGNQAVFQESLSSMEMRASTDPLSMQWLTAPLTTVHMVDPQNDSSNMGIAPFMTSWEISVSGQVEVELNTSRASLGIAGDTHPADLNLIIPLNFQTNATMYTPWPLESGPWRASGYSTDPTQEQTRGVIGVVGRDYGPSPTFVPGVYMSATLDQLFQSSASTAHIVNAEGFELTGLLAGLPDRAVGASASWSENLTRLENLTNTNLALTGGSYLTSVQSDFNIIRTDLAARTISAKFNGAGNAYFGDDFRINADLYLGTQLSCLAYFDTTDVNSCPDATLTGTYAIPMREYVLDFGGPRASVNFNVDGVRPGTIPAPAPVHGFEGSWGSSTSGSYSLDAWWEEFSIQYTLTLTAPSRPITTVTASHAYQDLSVPYIGPDVSANAVLSIWGTSVLPPAASSAFNESIRDWLPDNGVFENYVTEEQYAAGYLYDDLNIANPQDVGGVSALGYSTNLSLTPTHAASYSIYLQDTRGLFGYRAEMARTLAFLSWFEQNDRALSYDLGASSADPTVLSTATPYVLAQAYRNVTLAEGPALSPWLTSWSSENLAFTEADLGGASGGLVNTPTIVLGGWTSEGWGVSGTLTAA